MCPRHTAVLSKDYVILDIEDGPTEAKSTTVLKNKKHEPTGTKITKLYHKIRID